MTRRLADLRRPRRPSRARELAETVVRDGRVLVGLEEEVRLSLAAILAGDTCCSRAASRETLLVRARRPWAGASAASSSRRT
jgi:hypothetical protein